MLVWPACLHGPFSSITVHHKNGTNYPPINTTCTGQNNWRCWDKSPPPSCFLVVGGSLATFFYFMWTNSEAQTNQQSACFDVYGSAILDQSHLTKSLHAVVHGRLLLKLDKQIGGISFWPFIAATQGIGLGGGRVQYMCIVGCKIPPVDGFVAFCLVLTIEV